MTEPPPAPSTDDTAGSRPRSRARAAVSIVTRLLVAVVAIVVATVALAGIFDDLDLAEIGNALDRLSDAAWLALASGWLIWIGAQGLQTASLVTSMPARRGVLAFLGPSAVAAVIPGPSDLPVRYSMYRSWGVTPAAAATAVTASGIFSVGSQLVLPALAGVAIVVTGVEIGGFLTVVVATTLVLAVAIVVAVVALGDQRRTRWAGDRLDGAWHLGRRLLRRPTPPSPTLGEILVRHRATAIDDLRDKWLPTTGATVLTVGAKCSLLIMSLRFVGIPEDDLGWPAIFAVFALVAGLTIVPITPGSAGVAEFALVGMLAPIAGPENVNEVAAGVLVYRLLTWIMVIPTGFAALGLWKLAVRSRGGAGGGDAEP